MVLPFDVFGDNGGVPGAARGGDRAQTDLRLLGIAADNHDFRAGGRTARTMGIAGMDAAALLRLVRA